MGSGRIIVALDGMDAGASRALASKIGSAAYAFKIHDLWDREGPGIVYALKEAGAGRVWVDLKLKDTPDTVRLRAQAVRDAGADIVTVHASGGIDMMWAAVQTGVAVYAVTVLTSLSEEEAHLMHGQPSKAGVLYMARLAQMSHVAGIVCSPQEVGILASRHAKELTGLELVTPGIRLAGEDAGQQKRFDTPTFAIKQGATRLVVGSSITKAEDPVAAFNAIDAQIVSALA